MPEHLKHLIERASNTDNHIACCLPCHFSWEENKVLEFLPPEAQEWLIQDHKRLMERGLIPEEVLEHSREEMVFFRKYVPNSLLNKIEADHIHFCKENGFLYEYYGNLYKV